MKEQIAHPDPGSEFPIAEGCYILESWNTEGDEACSMARARLPAGETTHWHVLHGVAERYLIISGTGRVEVGDLPATAVTAGDVIFIPAEIRQRIHNTGTDDLVFYAICTPRFRANCYQDLEASDTTGARVDLVLEDLELDLLQRLQRTGEGISEYEFLQQLREARHPVIEIETSDAAEVRLFREHFQLFHLLYRLRDRCWAEKIAHIEINPLRLRVLPYQEVNSQMPGEVDNLRDYYLDRSHLDRTGTGEVNELLGRFWVRMQGLDKRTEALETLGLESGADYRQARERYRKLAMEHHPDRGGDAERLQEINLAMDILSKAYGKNAR